MECYPGCYPGRASIIFFWQLFLYHVVWIHPSHCFPITLHLHVHLHSIELLLNASSYFLLHCSRPTVKHPQTHPPPMPSLEVEHKKLLNRREELLKQDVSLRKDYSILLRKISSVCQVLESLGEPTHLDANGVPEFQAPDYEKFKEWDALIPLLKSVEEVQALPLDQIEVPEALSESYELFKMTPLLHKDGAE
ncbi:ino eighty subunit 5 [Kluyveromyces marxianus]|nr:ino eighty subunit 5 [Kluyveromyces marxianus]